MKQTKIALKLTLCAALLPVLGGCVTREVVYRPAPPPYAAAEPVATVAPAAPAAQVEVVPAAPGPADAYLWIPGEWVWRGYWVWHPGYWGARPFAGAIWIHGCWGWRGHHRIWVGAHWR